MYVSEYGTSLPKADSPLQGAWQNQEEGQIILGLSGPQGESSQISWSISRTDLMLYGAPSACDDKKTRVMPKEKGDHWPFNCICYN